MSEAEAYSRGRREMAEEIVEWVRREHDHFMSYVAIPEGADGIDDDELSPGNSVTFEDAPCPVEKLQRPFVDSLNLEKYLLEEIEKID